MKTIVTHASPDLDAITSVWLIKRFLPGWEDAQVEFVSAGERIQRLAPSKLAPSSKEEKLNAIEEINGNEVIHVDTGNGPLDHHSVSNDKVSASSLAFEFIKQSLEKAGQPLNQDKIDALERMVGVVTEIDHFKEVFWADPLAYYHDFSLIGILEGLKFEKPNNDLFYVDFISGCLDAIIRQFENRIWAEKEIKEKGREFQTKWGRGIGLETINDSVLKLAQKMDYSIVVRKDPRKGYVRIKAKPQRLASSKLASSSEEEKLNARRYTLNVDVDLTLVYEKLSKMDPEATWFLHVSKKMLLNGTVKNPKMKPTSLSLDEIIKVLESV
ncbi:hypothetical protein C4559_05245 [Candidatus Microgenomates bacterium]|nr:MAG: hypothetical protein C4559_05245 [Candidatus Microgenomates bacterium]